MNKVLISLVSIILLSGCSPTPMDKAKQDFVCKDRGGVYKYVISTTAHCRDGSRVRNWYNVTLTEEFYPKPERTNE